MRTAGTLIYQNHRGGTDIKALHNLKDIDSLEGLTNVLYEDSQGRKHGISVATWRVVAIERSEVDA